MGLKDRLLRAKCSAGFHSGDWRQIAAGSCDEQRDCVHCGNVSTRTDHHLADWVYATDPAAPACLMERRCQRCPQVERDVKHTMIWGYVELTEKPPTSGWDAAGRALLRGLGGRAERCRQHYVCTRCGVTDGKTIIKHSWDSGTRFLNDVGHPKMVYICKICGTEDVRNLL